MIEYINFRAPDHFTAAPSHFKLKVGGPFSKQTDLMRRGFFWHRPYCYGEGSGDCFILPSVNGLMVLLTCPKTRSEYDAIEIEYMKVYRNEQHFDVAIAKLAALGIPARSSTDVPTHDAKCTWTREDLPE